MDDTTALGSNQDGRALIQELGVTYPAGTTSESRVVRAFQVTGMPSTYFIKPNGEVVRKWTGLLTEAKLSELVQELLEAAASSYFRSTMHDRRAFAGVAKYPPPSIGGSWRM